MAANDAASDASSAPRRSCRARRVNSRFDNDEVDETYRQLVARIAAPDSHSIQQSPQLAFHKPAPRPPAPGPLLVQTVSQTKKGDGSAPVSSIIKKAIVVGTGAGPVVAPAGAGGSSANKKKVKNCSKKGSQDEDSAESQSKKKQLAIVVNNCSGGSSKKVKLSEVKQQKQNSSVATLSDDSDDDIPLSRLATSKGSSHSIDSTDDNVPLSELVTKNTDTGFSALPENYSIKTIHHPELSNTPISIVCVDDPETENNEVDLKKPKRKPFTKLFNSSKKSKLQDDKLSPKSSELDKNYSSTSENHIAGVNKLTSSEKERKKHKHSEKCPSDKVSNDINKSSKESSKSKTLQQAHGKLLKILNLKIAPNTRMQDLSTSHSLRKTLDTKSEDHLQHSESEGLLSPTSNRFLLSPTDSLKSNSSSQSHLSLPNNSDRKSSEQFDGCIETQLMQMFSDNDTEGSIDGGNQSSEQAIPPTQKDHHNEAKPTNTSSSRLKSSVCCLASSPSRSIESSDEGKNSSNNLNLSVNNVKSFSENLKALPGKLKTSDSVKACSDSLKTLPGKLKTSPDNLKTSPNILKSSVESLKTSPDSLKTLPESMRISPDNLNASSGSVKSSPDSLKTLPENSKPSLDYLETTPKLKTSADELKTSPHSVKISPVNLKTSPHHLKTSPHHLKTSPHHLKTSPHHTKTSLHHLKTSPHDMKTSPHDMKTSPHHMKTSPHHPKTSPHDMKASPHHLKTSPHHLKTSPHHLKTSPHDMKTSPHYLKMSPHHLKTSDHLKTAAEVMAKDAKVMAVINMETGFLSFDEEDGRMNVSVDKDVEHRWADETGISEQENITNRRASSCSVKLEQNEALSATSSKKKTKGQRLDEKVATEATTDTAETDDKNVESIDSAVCTATTSLNESQSKIQEEKPHKHDSEQHSKSKVFSSDSNEKNIRVDKNKIVDKEKIKCKRRSESPLVAESKKLKTEHGSLTISNCDTPITKTSVSKNTTATSHNVPVKIESKANMEGVQCSAGNSLSNSNDVEFVPPRLLKAEPCDHKPDISMIRDTTEQIEIESKSSIQKRHPGKTPKEDSTKEKEDVNRMLRNHKSSSLENKDIVNGSSKKPPDLVEDSVGFTQSGERKYLNINKDTADTVDESSPKHRIKKSHEVIEGVTCNGLDRPRLSSSNTSIKNEQALDQSTDSKLDIKPDLIMNRIIEGTGLDTKPLVTDTSDIPADTASQQQKSPKVESVQNKSDSRSKSLNANKSSSLSSTKKERDRKSTSKSPKEEEKHSHISKSDRFSKETPSKTKLSRHDSSTKHSSSSKGLIIKEKSHKDDTSQQSSKESAKINRDSSRDSSKSNRDTLSKESSKSSKLHRDSSKESKASKESSKTSREPSLKETSKPNRESSKESLHRLKHETTSQKSSNKLSHKCSHSEKREHRKQSSEEVKHKENSTTVIADTDSLKNDAIKIKPEIQNISLGKISSDVTGEKETIVKDESDSKDVADSNSKIPIRTPTPPNDLAMVTQLLNLCRANVKTNNSDSQVFTESKLPHIDMDDASSHVAKESQPNSSVMKETSQASVNSAANKESVLPRQNEQDVKHNEITNMNHNSAECDTPITTLPVLPKLPFETNNSAHKTKSAHALSGEILEQKPHSSIAEGNQSLPDDRMVSLKRSHSSDSSSSSSSSNSSSSSSSTSSSNSSDNEGPVKPLLSAISGESAGYVHDAKVESGSVCKLETKV